MKQAEEISKRRCQADCFLPGTIIGWYIANTKCDNINIYCKRLKKFDD